MSLAIRSPVLEPVLCVLQPGLQVTDAHLLLLQWGQVLLRSWGLDAMVVTAQCVLHGAPVGDVGHQGGREGGRGWASTALRFQGTRDTSLTIPVPWPLVAPCQLPSQGLCGHENTLESGFIKALLSDDHSGALKASLVRHIAEHVQKAGPRRDTLLTPSPSVQSSGVSQNSGVHSPT